MTAVGVSFFLNPEEETKMTYECSKLEELEQANEKIKRLEAEIAKLLIKPPSLDDVLAEMFTKKPVVWVYKGTDGYFRRCNEEGNQLFSDWHSMENWERFFSGFAEVRVWEPPVEEPEPIEWFYACYGSMPDADFLEKLARLPANMMRTMQAETPKFVVREYAGLYSAFRDGKRIICSWANDPKQSLERTLKQLPPGTTLDDLEVSDD